jgi:hypothetical protein
MRDHRPARAERAGCDFADAGGYVPAMRGHIEIRERSEGGFFIRLFPPP